MAKAGKQGRNDRGGYGGAWGLKKNESPAGIAYKCRGLQLQT